MTKARQYKFLIKEFLIKKIVQRMLFEDSYNSLFKLTISSSVYCTF